MIRAVATTTTYTTECDGCGRGFDRFSVEEYLRDALAQRGWTMRRRWQWRPPFVVTLTTCPACGTAKEGRR